MKLELTKIAAIVVGSLIAVNSAAAEEAVLNVYNWSDYIAEDTISNFEKQTGIKVNYDVFDSNEVLEAKLLAGKSGYDIVVPSASFMARQIQAGVFRKLDKSNIPNIVNVDPVIAERVAVYDPGNEYAVNYLWGTTGFGYNKAAIEKRMPDAPVGSWDMIFDPDVVSKFADCGVSLLDAPAEAFAAALQYLGLDPSSEDKADLQKAEELLLKIRPYIKYFHSSQYINDLANGDTCLAMGWSGDILQARDRANEADAGVEVVYTIPAEGALMWFDMLAIPVDAAQPDNAHKFINFVLDAKNGAEISDYVSYASGNAAAMELISDDVKSDPGVFPPQETMDKLFVAAVPSPKFDRLRTRAWTRVKTGS
jgi:putrescine transport system substrate-binding protein